MIAGATWYLRGKDALTTHSHRHNRRYYLSDIPLEDAARATESFITSATREVMPVRSLTLRHGSAVEFPEGGGSLTRQAMAHYKDFVVRYLREHAYQRLN